MLTEWNVGYRSLKEGLPRRRKKNTEKKSGENISVLQGEVLSRGTGPFPFPFLEGYFLIIIITVAVYPPNAMHMHQSNLLSTAAL